MTLSARARCALMLPWMCLAALSFAQSIPPEAERMAPRFEEDYDAKKWEEVEHQLPPPPKAESLAEIYVSAATEHRFFVDIDSVSLGKDGVARYTLVVKTSGGATNVSFEGMRCETRERRPYAFGRSDGRWSKARSNAWVYIREELANRHYATLYKEVFCPDKIIALRLSDVHRALRHQQDGAPRRQ